MPRPRCASPARVQATVGQLGNTEHEIVRIGKRATAGRLRPTVRGLAMNPVDHPHGGEARADRQPAPGQPWAADQGYKTRVNKRTTKFIIKRRDKGVR